jgi:hypothetical protein
VPHAFLVVVFPPAQHDCVFHIICRGEAIGARPSYCLFHIIRSGNILCLLNGDWSTDGALPTRAARLHGMTESQLTFAGRSPQCDLQSFALM